MAGFLRVNTQGLPEFVSDELDVLAKRLDGCGKTLVG
jgi:hypothetical protein